MTVDEFVKREIATWGEDYVYHFIDRGYVPVIMEWNGKLRGWWLLPTASNVAVTAGLTQDGSCATLPASRSMVAPVSVG